jgi:D-alanyl-D-alanine carboxypeptidase
MYKAFALFTIFALMAATPESMPAPTPSLADAKAIVASDVANGAFLTPSAQIAIVRGGRIASLEAYGLAAPGVPASNGTSYRIASITKMVTAVAVMQLVERGRLRLNDRLSHILPWVPHGSAVTIAELLAHSSGIPDVVDVVAHQELTRRVTPRDVVWSAVRKPLLFAPGTSVAYSNTEYSLLGLVVERVSSSSLAVYENENIFGPANMVQTSPDVAAPGTSLARGNRTPGDDDFAFDPSWFFGSGDLVSTAADVARFDIALMNGRLLRPATLDRMRGHELQATGFGLGLLQMRFADTLLIGHTGGLPGFGGATMLDPKTGTAVVALGNNESFDWEGAMIPLFTALYPQSVRYRPDPPGSANAETARLTAFVLGLQHGVVDRSTLSKELNAALDAKTLAMTAREFSSYGSLQRLVPVLRHAPHELAYDALFDRACYPLYFTIGPSRKIASY